MQKKPSNHFLHFTRKEKNGTIFLLFFIVLLILIPFFYPRFFPEKRNAPDDLAASMASLKIKTQDSTKKYDKNNFTDEDHNSGEDNFERRSDDNVNGGPLFDFDPNTLPASGWQKLGVKSKTIGTILNYISKGGKFREPADIRKIWGLHADQVQRLLPYVKIKASVNSFQSRPVYQSKNYEVKKSLSPIDINNADSTSLDELPGIGMKLSHRIISFREKLGGFYSIDQVAETFGLPDSTFNKIKNRLVLNDKTLRKVNINIATVDEMKIHPYIRYQLANAIVQFRNQHGMFSSIEEIKKIMTMEDELYNKLFPYLTIQ